MLTRKAIAERFATTDKEGIANSMFIDGDTIYSYGYHFPIARKTGKVDENNRPIVLFTNRGHSNTTARHKSFVYRALAEAAYRIIVTDIQDGRVSKEMVSRIQEEINELYAKERRARLQHMKDIHFQEAEKKQEDIVTLQHVFLS